MRRALALLAVLLLALPALAGGGASETVVLVNAASADSRRVAEHYAKKRKIPPEHLCEVKCDAALETSIEKFVAEVADPLREFLRKRGLEERCRFVVLTQGMPILARTPGGAVSTAAALSLLHTPVCGQPQTRFPGLKHAYTAGAAFTPTTPVEGRLLLVTALLSTTADEAIALVDRSVASDGTAPAGALLVFQDANGAANVRNAAYDAERSALEALGFATEHTKAGADAVTGRKRLIGYMSGGAYSAMTPDGAASNEYLPGALCDMLQSFGAVPGNFGADAKGHSQFPVTHMVRAGVTGVHGAVAEPYNVAFPDAQLFRPYLAGFTLAETFHQRMPYVYWMNLTLGDPLCAPYAKRPSPTLKAAGPWEGVVAAEVHAPGAVRIEVFDGTRLAGSVQGERGTVSIDTAGWRADQPRTLLVEATGPGEHEPRGWTLVAAKAGRNQPPAAPPAARTVCRRLAVELPGGVRAGDAAPLRVVAADAEGKPLAAWKGRIEVRTAAPPVRWAFADADAASGEVPLVFTRAASYELRVSAPDDGCETSARLVVAPGEFDHLTTPAQAVALGQSVDLDVVAEDRFQNRATDWAGDVSLAAPQDRFAELPPPAPAKDGAACLRGVLLTQAGRQALVFRDAAGRQLSLPSEGVDVRWMPLRVWLVGGPVPAKELFGSDASASATGDGAVAGATLLRRRVTGDVVALPAGRAKGGDGALLVTWIESLSPAKVRLLAAASGRVRVLLDGKVVFDGAPKASDPRGKREAIAELDLAEGHHRLAIALEAKADAAASFDVAGLDGKPPTALRVRARGPEPPTAFCVSGRLAGAAAGTKIVVAASDGTERAATVLPDGTWFAEGIPAGDAAVRVTRPGDAAPQERAVTIDDAHVVDVDFALPPPRR